MKFGLNSVDLRTGPEGSGIAPKGKEMKKIGKTHKTTPTKRSPAAIVGAIARNRIRSIAHLVGTLWDPMICETELTTLAALTPSRNFNFVSYNNNNMHKCNNIFFVANGSNGFAYLISMLPRLVIIPP